MLTMRIIARFGAVAIALILPAPIAQAQIQRSQPVDRSRPGIVGSWVETLEEVHRLLLEGEYKKARRTADGVLDDVSARVQSGEIGTLLAAAVALRSVAQAGLGKIDDALWDWFTAEALDRTLADSSLAVYGEAGELLERERELARKRPSLPWTSGIEPPEKVKAPLIEYPAGLRSGCAEGAVVIGVTIEPDGHPSRPWLIASGTGALMALTALETVRKWRFRPAQRDGRPVPIRYTLTVSFQISNCENLFATAKAGKKSEETMLETRSQEATLELPPLELAGLPASLEIRRIDPSPEVALREPKMLRIKVGYRVPAELLASGSVVLLPQFEQRDRGGTFVVQEPHARAELADPEGTITIYYELDHVWKSKQLAQPIRLWLYAVAVTEDDQMEVVGVAGPVTYERK